MFAFNIVSVLVYAALGRIAYRNPKHVTVYASIAMLEVALHAGAATLFIGMHAGFSIFIVCCAPFPFMIDFRYRATPIIIEFAFASEVIFLESHTRKPDGVIYTGIKDTTVMRLFIFNTCLSVIMMTVFSLINRLLREMEAQQMRDKNEELSMLTKIDPLSKLFNRRAMVDFLKRLDIKARNGFGGYIICMGDLDKFKHVNDTYGHASGDMVIQAVSQILTEVVPAEGYICRWGGEELLFAVPGADLEAGRQLCEKIRYRLGRHVFTSPEGVQFSVTITLGVCECEGRFSYERGVSIADQYLYYGKEQGRNRVITRENFPPELLK